ncbi:MAG: recombinase RecA [Candidatus Methanoperedenaceae archaeon HGW-Methanoperedenaceae-1]|jgi:KaiC/GvpD/RAD55 family RecA-like ATPase|nr:MAG: recombinase RecA [Candidatus Methanoperedenaceae archaeon HGW-Methanoperedenaceae-1]
MGCIVYYGYRKDRKGEHLPNGNTENGKKKSILHTLTRSIPKDNSSSGLADEILPEQINRLTGIPVLDRTLGGGLPSGSVVYIYADAKSMAEVFLYQFTQSRKTYYFSNERRTSYVMRDINNLGFNTNNTMFVDIYSEYYITPQGDMVDNIGNEFVDNKIVEFTEYNLKKLLAEEDGDINIIFDSFSFYMNLHVNPGIIKRLVNIIYEATKTLNCVTYLYGIKNGNGKLENDILKSCDVIFDVELEKNSDKISNKLSVPKIRGRTPTTEMIRFKVGDGVQIDTTKDIA